MLGRCQTCDGDILPTVAGHLCGSCLLTAAIDAERRFVGDYELFQKLGEGGMAEVYLAKHVASDEMVALKLAKASVVASAGGLAWFLQQARREASLQHPNIVRVLASGTHAGQPFLVMPLMDEGTLADEHNRVRFARADLRLKLVLKIARAVQFAHERGVLHCDLKHENILFDSALEPHVSDFGLARTLDGSGTAADSTISGGSPGWMPPEQVRGEALTTASDVFALGVMLYWLTTGEFPFGNREDFEARVLGETLAAPSRWTPALDWGLRAIAHRALQKAPEQRYESAAALADDLERLQQGECLRGWRVPAWGRAFYFAQSRPGLRNAILLLLPCFALIALLVSRSQSEELRRAVLEMNAYAASGQAAAVLYQLREYADAIERAAQDPDVKALVGGARAGALPAGAALNDNPCAHNALEDPAPLRHHAKRFSTIVALNSHGCARARIAEEPPPPDYAQRSFDWRDYFGGARADAVRGSRRAHVREAYSSSVSQMMKFAVSAPLFEAGQWVGVVTGSITVASTLEIPRTTRSTTSAQTTVLLGPLEPERAELSGQSARQFTFLAHPSLERGEKRTLDRELGADLEHAFKTAESRGQFELETVPPLQRADYVDPLLGDRWLAAFAPVGGTGYVVLVQTREAAATRPNELLTRLALGLTFISGAIWSAWGAFYLWRRRLDRHARAVLPA
jgi:serine/threonine-protein kinase